MYVFEFRRILKVYNIINETGNRSHKDENLYSIILYK